MYFIAKVKEKTMANKRFMMGVLIITLVLGMALVGCASGPDTVPTGADPALNGTWVTTSDELKLDNGSFENNYKGSPQIRGTYVAGDGNIRVTITQYYGGHPDWRNVLQSRWYTRDQFKAAVGDKLSDSDVNDLYKTMVAKYTVSGNTLTFRGGLGGKYSRQSGQYMIVNTDGLNVRSGPSADNAVVGTLARNTRVEVLERPSQWYKIRSGNIEGYVNSSLLKDE